MDHAINKGKMVEADEFNMHHKINNGKVVKNDYYPANWKKMAVTPLEEKEKSKNTIVTAYFEISKSKHTKSEYDTWMKNMLSLEDAMVIFTSPSLVSKIESFRSHAMNKTIIIGMKISDTMMVSKYSMEFWKNQFDMDPEKALHKSYELFWIWLSKLWFVTQAIEMNLLPRY